MKKIIAATVIACATLATFTGCNETSQKYLDNAVYKAKQLYENFDMETFAQKITDAFSSALEKGAVIAQEISGMTNEELAAAIKTAVFGDGTVAPGLGFDVTVNKSDISETEAQIETVISAKIGAIVLEKNVSMKLEKNENGFWFIAGFELFASSGSGKLETPTDNIEEPIVSSSELIVSTQTEEPATTTQAPSFETEPIISTETTSEPTQINE